MSTTPSSSPEAPASAGSREPQPVLGQFLAERDVPCPRCRYNLRGATGATCPECGHSLLLMLRGTHRATRLLLIVFLVWIGSLHTVTLWPTWGMVGEMHERMVVSLRDKSESVRRKADAIETAMRGGVVEDDRILSITDEESSLAAEAGQSMTDTQRVGALRMLEKQYEIQARSVPSTLALMWSLPRARITTPIALSNLAAAVVMLIVMWLARSSRGVLAVAGALSLLLAASYTVWLLAVWP